LFDLENPKEAKRIKEEAFEKFPELVLLIDKLAEKNPKVIKLLFAEK
jgi:hypothetical protein